MSPKIVPTRHDLCPLLGNCTLSNYPSSRYPRPDRLPDWLLCCVLAPPLLPPSGLCGHGMLRPYVTLRQPLSTGSIDGHPAGKRLRERPGRGRFWTAVLCGVALSGAERLAKELRLWGSY